MEAGPRENDDTAVEPQQSNNGTTGAGTADTAGNAGNAGGTGRSGSNGASAELGAGPDFSTGAESYADLRPPRRLRIWHLAPIVGLGALGSLMFAFPLAFDFEEGGAVVAILGLLLCCSAAGWGMMAARRVGLALPGLPPRGSGERRDWRVVALYAVVVTVLALLAIWRVTRLR